MLGTNEGRNIICQYFIVFVFNDFVMMRNFRFKITIDKLLRILENSKGPTKNRVKLLT